MSEAKSESSANGATSSGLLGVNDDGYWCVICRKFLPSSNGVIVHDDLPHPAMMNFNDEEMPQ